MGSCSSELQAKYGVQGAAIVVPKRIWKYILGLITNTTAPQTAKLFAKD
jgi:hypothetical protein